MKETSPIYRYRVERGLRQEDFGQLLNPPVDKSTVLRWERGQFLTPKRAIEIEAATNGSILRGELLPEIFGVPEAAQ